MIEVLHAQRMVSLFALCVTAGVFEPTAWAEGDPIAVVVAGRVLTLPEGEALAKAVRAELIPFDDYRLIPAEQEQAALRTPPAAAPELPPELERVEASLVEAQDALANFSLEGAESAIAQAEETIQTWSGLAIARDLDSRCLQLRVAISHAERNEAKLKEAVATYAIRYPSEPPPESWPPELLERLQGELNRADMSTLLVESQPKGLVYLDGREVGSTPIRLQTIPAGRHRIEVSAPLFATKSDWVITSKDKPASVSIRLEPNLHDSLRAIDPGRSAEPVLVRAIATALPGLRDALMVAGDGDRVAYAYLDLARGEMTEAFIAPINNPTAQRRALAQALASSSRHAPIPEWALAAGGGSLAAIGLGVMFRLMSAGTHGEFEDRISTINQVDAYSLRGKSNREALLGTILIGLGVATVVAVSGWLVVEEDLVP